jgi:hypothetical protein
MTTPAEPVEYGYGSGGRHRHIMRADDGERGLCGLWAGGSAEEGNETGRTPLCERCLRSYAVAHDVHTVG